MDEHTKKLLAQAVTECVEFGLRLQVGKDYRTDLWVSLATLGTTTTRAPGRGEGFTLDAALTDLLNSHWRFPLNAVKEDA